MILLSLFYFFAVFQAVLSLQSFLGGLRYLRFFREELAKVPDGPFPAVTLIVPFKGLDQGMEENLRAVLSQDYPSYEAVFVVDDADDPAVGAIMRAMSAVDLPAKLVIAGMAENTGQKSHNLIAAVREASESTEVFVFADSDARPSKGWMRSLVSAAVSEENGCASGYRWFVQKQGGLGTFLRSVWNASIASALGPNKSSNFCWGGSTAILREVFENAKITKAWEGVVSDDFAMTRAVNLHGGAVRFVPACLTATIEDCTIAEMLEFTTRQIKLTRVYSPRYFVLSLVGSSVYSLSLLFAAFTLVTGGVHSLISAVFLLLLGAQGTAKAEFRLRAARLALEGHNPALDKQRIWQLTLWAVTPFIFLYNDVAALLSRRIIWRGVEYELESPERTRIVGRY